MKIIIWEYFEFFFFIIIIINNNVVLHPPMSRGFRVVHRGLAFTVTLGPRWPLFTFSVIPHQSSFNKPLFKPPRSFVRRLLCNSVCVRTVMTVHDRGQGSKQLSNTPPTLATHQPNKSPHTYKYKRMLFKKKYSISFFFF